MILQWMVAATASGALVAAAAQCAERVATTTQRARRWVWVVAIAASSVAAVATPRFPIAHAAAAPATSTAIAAIAVEPAVPLLDDTDVALLALWAVASIGFAGILVVSHLRLVRTLRALEPATVADQRVLLSRDFGPATIGLLRHRIVVPSWILSLSDDDRRLVMTHETEHARAGDSLLALAGVVGVALMPWNVALWWQLSRLRLAIEVDCDARVVRATPHGALVYGQLLLRVREHVQTTRQPALALAHARSSLGKRLDALLADRERAPRWLAAGIAAAVGAGLVSSVAFVPGPRAAEILAELRPARAAVAAVAVAPLTRVAPPATSSVAESRPRTVTRPRIARDVAPSRAATHDSSGVVAVPPVMTTAASAAATTLPAIDRVVILSDVLHALAAAPPRRSGVVMRAMPTTKPPLDSSERRSVEAKYARADSAAPRTLRAVGGRLVPTPRPAPDSVPPAARP